MKIFKYISTILFLLVSCSVFAEYTPEIDSLINVVNTQKDDTLKVDNLNILCWNLKSEDFEKSKEYGEQAASLAKTLEFTKGEALANKNLGGIHYLQSKYAIAYPYYIKSFELYKSINDKTGISKITSNLGSIFHMQGEYDKAIDFFFQSLEIKRELGDKIGVAKQYNRIGLVCYEQGKDSYANALDYYDKAIKIYEELDYKVGIAASYYRIAGIYNGYGDEKRDKALEYALKFLNLSNEIADKTLMAQANQIVGSIYLNEKGFEKDAFRYLNHSLVLWDELGNSFGVADLNLEIAKYYSYINEYKNAERYLQKALEIAIHIEAPILEREIYEALSILYKLTSKFEKALIYMDKYYALKDTLQSEAMANAITRLEVKNEFNSQLKEQKIEQEKMEIQFEADQKRSRILTFSALFVLILVLIFSLFMYRSLRDKQKANKLLEEKNEKINVQNLKIQKQHDVVLEQKEQILASISYAQKIQTAVLPSPEYTKSVFYDYFILFKPRDIVSGDFYWIRQIEDYTVVVAADCTGHGVPGAFMSMLGTSFLNAVVTTGNLESTADILNELRNSIKKALHQKGDTGEQKDGMDLALYIINNKTNMLQFSGAYNPLFVLRNNMQTELKAELDENECIKILELDEYPEKTLIELKADRQPIGIYLKEKEFTNTNLQLKKGDKLYTFSDGFVDQFGGVRGDKFKTKNFKNLLFSICNKPMSEQQQIIEKTLHNWMAFLDEDGNPYEQIDDIIIIGIEIP